MKRDSMRKESEIVLLFSFPYFLTKLKKIRMNIRKAMAPGPLSME
jgi:hypothetical protein